MRLKCCLHSHTNEETREWIFHNAKQLIKTAANLKYDVLAFTCHDFFFDIEDLKEEAKKQGVILIPGIELSINKKHILILNTTAEITKVKSFEDLKKYKERNSNCLIIAPHPYFPGPLCLKQDLEKNIDLFDGIELSHFYLKSINYNKQAEYIAKKYQLPLLATGDVHMKEQLLNSYCFLDAEKKDINNILSAIKKQKITNYSKPLTLKEFFIITTKMAIITIMSYFKTRKKQNKNEQLYTKNKS